MEKQQTDEITVSVLCTAYRHEPYLRQCLDGIVASRPVQRAALSLH